MAIDAFESTYQKTNEWLEDIMKELDLEGDFGKRRAYQALRSTLHALRDMLTPEEAADLSARLPMLVRGLYFEGWRPAGKPKRPRNMDEFLASVAKRFERAGDGAIDPDRIARAVFRVMSGKVAKGELEDIKGLCPKRLDICDELTGLDERKIDDRRSEKS